MLKRPSWPAGRVVVLEHASKVLRDNPLADPATRPLAVWLPPQYDEGATRNRGKVDPRLKRNSEFWIGVLVKIEQARLGILARRQ